MASPDGPPAGDQDLTIPTADNQVGAFDAVARFEALFPSLSRMAVRRARIPGLSKQDCQNAAQDALLILLDKWDHFALQPDDQVERFVSAVVRKRALNIRDTNNSETQKAYNAGRSMRRRVDPWVEAEQRIDIERLIERSHLTPDEDVAVRARLDGDTYPIIAAESGEPLSTIKSRVERAAKKIARRLESQSRAAPTDDGVTSGE